MGLLWAAVLAASLLMSAAMARAEHEVTRRDDIVFAEHDGVRLLGDLYAPKGLDKAPALSPIMPMRSGSMPKSPAFARTYCTAALAS